jgi:hypothetical protein
MKLVLISQTTMLLGYRDDRDTEECRCRCRGKCKTLRALPFRHGIKLVFSTAVEL